MENPTIRNRAASLLLILATGGAGCAGIPRGRPASAGERFELQSLVAALPPEAGWRAFRSFDAGERQMILVRESPDKRLVVFELDDAAPAPRMDELQVERGRVLVCDSAATITEFHWTPEARFGSSATVTVYRAEESAGRAGILVKRVAFTAVLTFRSPEAPGRTCTIVYEESGPADELAPERVEERWRARLRAVELRPASPENVASAARAEGFPKQFSNGLARRTLTLQKASMQLGYWGSRRLAPGGWDGGVELRFGLTDRLELAAPGFLRYSFGEPEALTRPEFSVGAGLTHYDHDALRGNVWGFGAEARARRRIGPDVAWRVGTWGEAAHESRTGRDTYGGGAAGGLVWDAHRFLSVGLEVGGSAEPAAYGVRSMAWIGGLATPLVTFQVSPINLVLGLRGALAIDHGTPGFVVGFMTAITL